MAWGNLGTTTLSSTGSPVTVSGYTASTFSQELHHGIESGSYGSSLRFNNDSGSVYANRRRQNGTAENSNGNRTFIENVYGGDTLMISFMGDIDGEEKMIINLGGFSGSSGAGNAPNRLKLVGKYVPSPTARITEVNRFDSEGGAHGIDTNLTVLGSDSTPAAAVPALGANIQVGSRFEETDNRKMYNLYDPTTNVLYEDATGQSNTSGHGTVVFIGDNATYATLFSRIAATNTTHPHPAVNVDTPNKAFSSSDPWTIELTFKESYTIPSGSTITYNSYNNGQGARLKYLDFQVYTGSTWENITGTITNPNHSDGDVETISGRWVKYMTSTTTTEKTGTKFRVRMWDSWDNFVTNGRHYIGGIELKIPIGNVEWQEIGA